MARPGIDVFWVEHIRRYDAEHRDWSGDKIAKELATIKNSPATAGRVPSVRAINRARQNFRGMENHEQQRYRDFRWPDAMLNKILPWEAASCALELVRFKAERGLAPIGVKEAEWFWRVTLACPTATVERRVGLTELALVCMSANDEAAQQYFEKVLAFQPWRSVEDHRAWEKLPETVREGCPRELNWQSVLSRDPQGFANADALFSEHLRQTGRTKKQKGKLNGRQRSKKR